MVQAQSELPDGAVGSLTASSNSPFGSGHRLEIYGDEGAIHLINSTRDYLDGFTVRCVNRQGEVLLANADQAERPAIAAAKDGRIRAVAEMVRRFSATRSRKASPPGPIFATDWRVQLLLDASAEVSSNRRLD